MSHVKEEIAKELNLKVVTINKAISILSEKNILLRKARGCYLMNPFFFGRGKWENIKKIRMELEYDTDGKHTFRVNIDKESVVSIFENEAKKEV
jgi:DNA-binding GntR family transcriptional regulator